MPNPYDKYGPANDIEDLFPSAAPTQRRQRNIGPLRVRKPRPEEPEVPEPQPEEDLGWFRTYGPHVARGIGGLLGVTPLTGALGGAAGETVAQAIEQGDITPEIDPKRLAAETAIGAMGGGFAKLLGSGLTSVGRALAAGAAMGGAAPVVRHGFEEGEWDPREYAGEVGTGAAIGGTVGGGLAKLIGKAAAGRPAGPASRYEIETTAVPGGQTLGASGQKTQYVTPIRPISGSMDVPVSAAPSATRRVPYDPADAATPIPETPKVPYMGTPVDETAQQAAARLRAEAAQSKADQEATKLRELQELFAQRGDDLETRLSESVSAVDPVTGHRLGATFREVAEEGADGGGGAAGTLFNQADEPVELASEIERVRAELAQARATEAPQTPEPVMAAPEAPTSPTQRYYELVEKDKAGTLTAAELAEARALDADLRGRGFRDDPTPTAPIPAQAEAPAPSPLAEVLTPPQAGKTRVSRPRKGKTERFNERAAAIAAQAEAPAAPAAPQSLAELLSQVDPNRPPTRILVPGEGVVSAPIGADPADALAALRSAGPEAPALPAAPEAPPQDLLQILRTRVGATGKNYRLAREAAKSGEIPSAALAREAHLREQAALKAPKPAGTVPEVTPATDPTVSPASWIDEETREVERLMALPKEQRLAAFLGDESATPPPAGTVAPDAPLATPEAEPSWVAEQMAEVNRLSQPQAPPPPAAPPTAAQVSELEKLLMASGAIKDPSQMPKWVTEQLRRAPEAPTAPAPASTVLTKPGQEGAPRLVRRSTSDPPNPQDYRPTYTGPKTPDPTKGGGERGAYPAALAARLGLGVAGAAIGGATDPLDDPLLSAMAGGAVGLSIPTIAQGLMKLGAAPEAVQSAVQDLNLPDGTRRAAAKIARVLPQMQRANYLADIIGLGANAWFGPYGSGVFGALEKGLAGDPRGWAVLNELKNPWSFFREYRSAYDEARQLVGRAEGFSEAEAVGALEKKLTIPGTILTAGDVSIRRILERHGFSEDEARIMTMTGEPFTRSGESLAHLRGFIPDITFPFKRTPINIVEQGLLRTPGVGFAQQALGAARGTRAADPLSLQLAQQGIGAGIGLGAEQFSEQLDPEQARVLRRFVTNAAGPYSLLAATGFAAGQAARRGQPLAGTTARTVAQQLPLPSIEPIQEALGLGAKVIDQGPSAIRGEDIPRGAYPAGLVRHYQALEEFFNQPKLPPRRRRRTE